MHSKDQIMKTVEQDKDVIILVPYRDRETHLSLFIPAITSYLPEAKVYVIEQYNHFPFNRGWLLNAGFLETENIGQYWIMHDVDMLPEDVDYSYPEQPIHLATQCSQFNYSMPYSTYFGGVNAFNSNDFRAINGFVNSMRGWGGEDDILYRSFIERGLTPASRAGRFNCLDHPREINRRDYSHNLALVNRERDFNDGLSTCRYTVIETIVNNNFIHIKIS